MRRGFATNELLQRTGLVALVFIALMPAMAALRDALAAEPPLTAWQVAAAVAWGLAKGVIPLVVLCLAVVAVVGLAISRILTFRPGTRVRVRSGPWAGREGVVAEDHDPDDPHRVAVVFMDGGVERRESVSNYAVAKWWQPRWL